MPPRYGYKRSLRFKLSDEIISLIKEMPSVKLWDNQKLLKDNNLELIIPSPYIREISKNRDENLKKAQAIVKEFSTK